MSKNLSLFNLNTFNKSVKPSEKPSEEASKHSEPSEKASVKASDWEQIFQAVRKYIYSKCWDTRLEKEDIVQECMLYIFHYFKEKKEKEITPFYAICLTKNYINRVLLKSKNNGSKKTEQGNLFFNFDSLKEKEDIYYRCAKSVFHLENFVSFESLRKI